MLDFILDFINQSALDIKDWLFRISDGSIDVSPDTIQLFLDVITLVLFLILVFIKPLTLFLSKIRRNRRENKRWRVKYIEDNLHPSFYSYKNERLKEKCYINTRIQLDTPSKYEEPYAAIANSVSSDFISQFIDKVFKDDNVNGHLYCILAGSGMGKSTALVNLFISYISHYKQNKMPYDIRLFSLADGNIIESIEKVNRKYRTILLLDALDENVEAVDNLALFMDKLETACKDFKFVLLSCRTQFFPDEDAQLKESKLIKDGMRKGYVAYTTFYISPFNDNEVKTYIKRVFGFLQFGKRKKAMKIVNKEECKYLLVRPMILSHMKQLVNDKREYNSTIDIYDAIVDYWLDREVGRESDEIRLERKKILRTLSEELAKNIYLHKDERKGYYISANDFKDFLSSQNINNDIHFRERSLINRDAIGDIKFSHKSFLEYFIAYKCAFSEMYIHDFTGMDIAKRMYLELCKKECDELQNQGEIKIQQLSSKKDNTSNVMLFKIKNFKSRWLDYVESIHLTTSSKLLTDILKEDNLLWYNKVRVLDIRINDSSIQYLKLLNKLSNIYTISIRGDIGMKKKIYIDKLCKMFPKITLVINGEIVVEEGLIINKIKISRYILDTLVDNDRNVVYVNNSYHRKYH